MSKFARIRTNHATGTGNAIIAVARYATARICKSNNQTDMDIVPITTIVRLDRVCGLEYARFNARKLCLTHLRQTDERQRGPQFGDVLVEEPGDLQAKACCSKPAV